MLALRHFPPAWSFACTLMMGWSWLDAKCPPDPLYHSPPQVDWGEKNKTKGS